MITITINRKPVSWAPPRRRGRIYYDTRFEEKNIIRTLIASQYDQPIIETAVGLDLEFHFKPPKATSKKKYTLMVDGEIPHQGHIDVSNITKLIEDCLKGIVIKDDSQVVYIKASKRWAMEDKIIIKLEQLTGNKES